MAFSGFQEFRSDNGTPVVASFEYGPGFEYAMVGNVWTRDEEHDFTITDAERDRFEAWLMEHRSVQDQIDSASQD